MTQEVSDPDWLLKRSMLVQGTAHLQAHHLCGCTVAWSRKQPLQQWQTRASGKIRHFCRLLSCLQHWWHSSHATQGHVWWSQSLVPSQGYEWNSRSQQAVDCTSRTIWLLRVSLDQRPFQAFTTTQNGASWLHVTVMTSWRKVFLKMTPSWWIDEGKVPTKDSSQDWRSWSWRGSVRRNALPQNHQVEPSRFQLGSRSQVCSAIGKGHGPRQGQRSWNPSI